MFRRLAAGSNRQEIAMNAISTTISVEGREPEPNASEANMRFDCVMSIQKTFSSAGEGLRGINSPSAH